MLGLAAALLAAALPAPASASAPSPSYAETRVRGSNLEIAAGVEVERGSSPTRTEAYGLRYDEPAVGYPLVPRGISNPVPQRVARVIDARLLGRAEQPGPPGAADVFITAADDLAGLTSSEAIAQRLTLLNRAGGLRRGPFAVIEFDAPPGIASPVFRTDPGFVGFGRTAGGAREFVVPNVRFEELSNVTVRRVP